MRQRRETVEHPFGTLKMRMGATHFLMKRLPKVATEMALHVLAYNLTRAVNILASAANGCHESIIKQDREGQSGQPDNLLLPLENIGFYTTKTHIDCLP